VSFDLDLEADGFAGTVMGMDNYVIQRVPLGHSLQSNMVNCATGEAAGLCTGEHGQQIIGADLSLEMWSSRTAGSRARHLLTPPLYGTSQLQVHYRRSPARRVHSPGCRYTWLPISNIQSDSVEHPSASEGRRRPTSTDTVPMGH